MFSIIFSLCTLFLGYILLCKRINYLCNSSDSEEMTTNKINGSTALDNAVLAFVVWVAGSGIYIGCILFYFASAFNAELIISKSVMFFMLNKIAIFWW